MSGKVKAVIDTNIWISALLSGSNALALVDALDRDKFSLVSSVELLDELERVVARRKFADIMFEERSQNILKLINEKALIVKIADVLPVSRDPKDDIFLACALAGHADYLVTGDDDLLCLKDHEATKIVRLVEFLAIIEEE
ncbi:MAG: putative toxin-antitoxin system toxin component, PIN family [Cyanobacteriota/Melainabacteria group bacterium]